MDTIYFATSNARKAEEVGQRISRFDINIEPLGVDVDELQHISVHEVAKTKLRSVIEKYPGRRLLVDDRGLIIPALNGFPGAYFKAFLQYLTREDILHLMDGKQNRSVEYITVLGYFDGICEHYFFEEEKGFIAEAIRGENLRGWNDFLTIYGHISNPNKTLAEYTDAEWDFYIKQLEANDCITQFAKSIKG